MSNTHVHRHTHTHTGRHTQAHADTHTHTHTHTRADIESVNSQAGRQAGWPGWVAQSLHCGVERAGDRGEGRRRFGRGGAGWRSCHGKGGRRRRDVMRSGGRRRPSAVLAPEQSLVIFTEGLRSPISGASSRRPNGTPVQGSR